MIESCVVFWVWLLQVVVVLCLFFDHILESCHLLSNDPWAVSFGESMGPSVVHWVESCVLWALLDLAPSDGLV